MSNRGGIGYKYRIRKNVGNVYVDRGNGSIKRSVFCFDNDNKQEQRVSVSQKNFSFSKISKLKGLDEQVQK